VIYHNITYENRVYPKTQYGRGGVRERWGEKVGEKEGEKEGGEGTIVYVILYLI
jgi:hypothetical protein